jgi:hypothetical protein
MGFDKDYFLKFGHHNDNIGTVLRHQKLIKKSGRVLVVPCGYGQIVSWCLSNSIDCNGYDINEFLLSNLQVHLRDRISKCDVRSMPEPSSKYNLLICLDLLEHLPEEDMVTCINNIGKNLSVDGKAIIRIGTDDLDCFEEDPTHQTKKSFEWWIEKFSSCGLNLYYGPTEVGEFIVSRNYEHKTRGAFDRTVKKCELPSKHAVAPHNDAIVLIDAAERKWHMRKRSDGRVQVDIDNEMFISVSSVASYALSFDDEFSYVVDLNTSNIQCVIPFGVGKRTAKVQCMGDYDVYQERKETSVVLSDNSSLLKAQLIINDFQDGDIFVITNENNQPVGFLGIRKKAIVAGFHFSPDNWIQRILTRPGQNAINVDINFKKDECADVTINGIKTSFLHDGLEPRPASATELRVKWGRDLTNYMVPESSYTIVSLAINGNVVV